MNMKEHILAALREQFERWEELLSGLTDEQITAPQFDLDWSIKDVVAHLWAWQQTSLVRVDAGADQREPVYPEWIAQLPGDWEENTDRTNAWFYEICHTKTWAEVHQLWREGFLQFLGSGEAVAEMDLLAGDRYPWLHGYSLADVLLASYEHHQEHLEKLTAWLQQHP